MFDKEKYDWGTHKDQMAEADKIKKDISTARGIINDALLRYKKKMLKARSKKQVEDMSLLFKDLEPYRHEEDIRDAYGWDFISEKEMDRLMDLWEARKKYIDESGKFRDRVTDLVQTAMNGIGGEYFDFLDDTQEAEYFLQNQKKEIEKENARRDWERRW